MPNHLHVTFPRIVTQARSKVHVYMTLFSNFMELVHPYEEPVQPPPLCAFKFYAQKFTEVRDACANFQDAVEYFGAFEFDQPQVAGRIVSTPEDFEKKVSQSLCILFEQFKYHHRVNGGCA